MKGLTSASNYRDLIDENIIKTKPGYIVESHILNAKDFGIPQNRERLFFIGVRSDISKRHKITPQKIFIDILESKSNMPAITVSDAIHDLPQIKSNPKPNNYKKNNELSFKDKNSFGMNVSDLDYKKLVNKPHAYINRINSLANGKLPKNLLNHKSRYHNKRDKYIYMNLNEGKYLDHPDNFTALNGDNQNFNGVDYIKETDKNGNKIPTEF